MTRVALSLYLIIATAAGPWWLCCCAPGRVVELLASLKPANYVEEGTPNCCCKHEKGFPTKPVPDKSSPPRVPCECKDTQPTPYVQGESRLDELRQLSSMQPGVDITVESLQIIMTQVGLGTTPLPAFPGLSGRELLALNHILRC